MLGNILLLVLGAVGGFFSVLFMGRLYMQWARVSFRNELGHFVLKLTDWAVLPLRRVFPGLLGIDLASLAAVWALQVVLVLLEYWLRGFGVGSALGGLVVLGIGLVETVRVLIYLLIGILIVVVVLSWVNPHSPIAPLFSALSRPFLRPLQRIIPPVANIDLSPLVLLLVFQVMLMVLGTLRASLTPLLAA